MEELLTPLTLSTPPLDVYQSAVAARLGDQPYAEHHIAPLTGGRIVFGISFLAFGLGIDAVGIGNVATEASVGIMLTLFGLFFVGLALSTLFSGLIYKGWCVYVYEHGFIHKKGRAVGQVFRWDEIDAVWYQVIRHRFRKGLATGYAGTTHRYRVRRQDSYEIVLNDHFTNVSVLGNTICNQATKAKLPQAINAYNAGQTISFGTLSLNREGIQNSQGTFLPWSKIEYVKIANGYIVISRTERWPIWPPQQVDKIPNVFVFSKMIEYIKHSSNEERQP